MGRKGWAIGAGALAVGVLLLGLVFQNQADFSRDYVKRELSEKGIFFTPAANLLPQQKDIACLNKYAEKPLTTGKQAECYARYQIGIDLTVIDGGKTYFQDHYNGYLARVAAAEALQSDPGSTATADLVKKAEQVQRTADDLLAGEATRGLLLSAYAFSVIGDRLATAALVCFIIAGLLLLVGVYIFVTSARNRPAIA